MAVWMLEYFVFAFRYLWFVLSCVLSALKMILVCDKDVRWIDDTILGGWF